MSSAQPEDSGDRAPEPLCTAFAGQERIATGTLEEVAAKSKEVFDRDPHASILIFDNETSELVEVDFGGSPAEVMERVTSRTQRAAVPDFLERRGRGRPRMGVVGREVTLLPRHWEWLDEQPGGASVMLRKLVEEARRANPARDRIRRAQEAVHRFMWALAGDLPGFEEASRAFYRKNYEQFDQLIESWPEGIRTRLRDLVAAVRRNELL